jgi:MYXO-CTERM domain-containing protein
VLLSRSFDLRRLEITDMNNRLRMQPHRRWLLPTAVAMATVCAASVAWAGEIKFGTSKLEVDDKGNLTAAGRKGVVDTVDEVPGEDRWEVSLWSKLDNAAEGPLYIYFYQTLNGTTSEVWRHDENDFAGGKYYSADIVLEGGRGFNKDRTYDVKAIQVSPKGKDLTLATGKIKLIKSGKKPEKGPDEEKEDEVPEDQDVHDSLAGDEPAGDGSKDSGEAPPAVEPKAKKGCSIDNDSSAWNGALLLVILGAGLAARRRR